MLTADSAVRIDSSNVDRAALCCDPSGWVWVLAAVSRTARVENAGLAASRISARPKRKRARCGRSRRMKLLAKMGATAVEVMNVSGADPLGTIRLYGEHVLPELRG